MIVGVSGFSWSGSGAVIDYLMEFKENQVYTTEFIIAYHPDGLHDLDINLNENCAKFLSSGVALPRFKKIANYLLTNPTKGKAKYLINDYLNEITQAKWIGSEAGQVVIGNMWLYRHFGDRIKSKIIFKKLSQEFCWKYKPYPLREMMFSICPDNFDVITRGFIRKVLKEIGLDTQKNIVLNQPFPGNNPVPYMKYFDNPKAIVVDRDPRDVFVLLKYVFPGRGYSVPLESVDEFCAYYDNMHKNLSITLNHPDVLYIKFEDLVYHYNNTCSLINNFLQLGDNLSPKKYFIPEESAANTQLFIRFGKQNEIKVIEQKLSKYLYDFSKVQKYLSFNKLFDDNPKSKNYSFKKR